MMLKAECFIVTCSGEEIEKWIVATVGDGGYLSELVRGYFVVLQESHDLQEDHRHGLEDRRIASQNLLDLNATSVRFPAQSYTAYQPRPAAISGAYDIYNWNQTQLHRLNNVGATSNEPLGMRGGVRGWQVRG